MAAFAGSGQLLLLLLFMVPAFAAGKLSHHFYKHSCPAAEEVVRQTVEDFYSSDPAIAAGIIRLHFHDCFVRGCDASVLLDTTPSGEPVEKSSPANIGLYGEHVIDAAKFQLENLCPETVSCADILAFAARDAAAIAGIPQYSIPSGRRDGTVSFADDTFPNLPAPFFHAEQQLGSFKKKGFSLEEMVVLAGAHSIGGAHCKSFAYRLDNLTAGGMESGYALFLRQRCPPAAGGFNHGIDAGDVNPKVDFVADSGRKLDGSYYAGLQRGFGLLESDQALMKDEKTRNVVKQMGKHARRWSEKFARAMIKLGKLDVLTGGEGEVRLSCRTGNVREELLA
ncbi:Peroxidase 1 [Platanthera guangdongensis]|uniref:Peroxidase n=1 Tax=Platanthera guangdongensis TaxID=2320717 RepID=A0ABR2MNB6_9ASPA